jgi:hypothetical protein
LSARFTFTFVSPLTFTFVSPLYFYFWQTALLLPLSALLLLLLTDRFTFTFVSPLTFTKIIVHVIGIQHRATWI